MTLLLVLNGGLSYSDALTDLFWSNPTGEGFWSGVGRFFHKVVSVLIALVLSLVGLVIVAVLSSIVAAPFNDFLSEEVERLRTGRTGPPFSLAVLLRDLVRTIGIEMVKLTMYAAVMIPLFISSLLVPVVGQILYSIFSFWFTSIYFAGGLRRLARGRAGTRAWATGSTSCGAA